MHKRWKTALMGAGAVGAYVVDGLYDKADVDFVVVAKGERKARLESEGLVINGRRFMPRIVEPGEAAALEPDYLVIALKYTALEGSLEDIAEAVAGDTCVISIMNGIDSEEIIGARIGMEHMLHGLIKIASTRDGNNITFPYPRGENMGIFVGVPARMYSAREEERKRARAEDFRELFDGTKVLCHVSDDILKAMWDKFGLNMALNLPQAVLGAGAGIYEDSVYVDDLSRKLRHEVVELAAAMGVTLREEFYYNRALKYQRYSTLQDLDAGRRTEIEMLSGAHIRMARKAGVPCPYNEVMYDLIKALEEKNEGKFDYE